MLVAMETDIKKQHDLLHISIKNSLKDQSRPSRPSISGGVDLSPVNVSGRYLRYGRTRLLL